MNRKLFLLPAAAAMVWAQQTSPAAEEAKQALTERVSQFYQLQIDKKYRQAEALVADDTKDLYFSSGKGELLGFSIVKIELSDNDTKAKVTVKAKATMVMMGVGLLPYEAPSTSLWKVENGKWCWYVDPDHSLQSPFGKLQPGKGSAPNGAPPDLAQMVKAPDIAQLQGQVHADRTTVTLSASEPLQTATISNDLPGPVVLSVSAKIKGISVEVDKTHLAAGEKAALRIQRIEDIAAEGLVYVEVSPLDSRIDIKVQSAK